MGLKNAGSQFQRMMEWVLRDLPNVDPYLDDILIGSMGDNLEELIENHYRDVVRVMETLQSQTLVCNPVKSLFFQREVEFCGHILRDGVRSPAPGKLLPIQKWVLPRTVTELRQFLGLTNYFSEYVPNYAETAAPLMGKLKLNREDGKKGSKLPVVFGEVERRAFEELKRKLADNLSLFQPQLDQPFILRTDASDTAIGAQLCQKLDGKLRTVALYSRKLTSSQLNWAVKEKEMYAVIAALHKWSGIINFQPVLVQTDHRALEHWVTENVETPSGPRGRRGRWHEILSQFDLEIEYLPGAENTVADAMSRWAYPASSSRQDVSWHGTKEAKEEVDQQITQDFLESRGLLVVRSTDEENSFWCHVLPQAQETARVCPVKFKFWRDMTPEERAKELERRATTTPETSSTLEGAGPATPDPIPRGPLIEPTGEFESGGQGHSLPTPDPARPPAGFRFTPRRPEVGSTQNVYILDEEWGANYEKSDDFKADWINCHRGGTMSWPPDVQLFRNKLYKNGKLCVPDDRAEPVLLALHVESGHPGVKRLALAANAQFLFSASVPVQKKLKISVRDVWCVKRAIHRTLLWHGLSK